MKAFDIMELLKDEGFDLQEDTMSKAGWGSQTFIRYDGEELVQVIVSVNKAEN